jgi:hypothetical protein
MIKFIGSGLIGAVTMAGAGYNYINHQNATIESQQRAITEAEQQRDVATDNLKIKNALIDHVIQELRDSRGTS